jgi:hypothetical protein
MFPLSRMKRLLSILLIVLGAVAFVAGLVQLFLLRFEAGDVYPPYSSLRADPLGTMAIYESLDELQGVTVRRDFSDANKLPEEKDTTYLHLAAAQAEWSWLPPELFTEIEAFATRGGRFAIAMAPVTSANPFTFAPMTFTNAPATNSPATNAPTAKPGKPVRKAGPRKIPLEDTPRFPGESVEHRWGLAFAHQALELDEDGVYRPTTVTNVSGLNLPATLEWHSALVFTNLAPAWRTIYARGTNPVVVERSFGRGTVVMASDSYFLSNEALWKARHADVLAWFVGPAKHVVFDEAHLGVVEESGMAVLLRKYRLYGVVGALVVLAGLFIWKNAVSLVPPHADEARKGIVVGKDAASGFVNLLRRNIPPPKILDVCFEEWTKTIGHGGKHTIASVDRASEIMEAESARSSRQRDPVAAYQQIAAALKRSKFQVPGSKLPAPGQEAPRTNQLTERNKYDDQKV